MTATFYVGDAIEVMNSLPEKSVDLVLSSPPFLALRSYLPADHPDKAKEGGSQATPGEFIDWLLDVVEACARVLAPHGSLCFELGDTYSGSGGAGGDYAADGLREGQPTFKANPGRSGYTKYKKPGYATGIPQRLSQDELPKTGRGWPLAKSLSLIPESFRWAMVYGHNPHTGRTTEPWRLRNVIRWVRPNPPVGALGDKFRPATSELMVFCKATDRFFDLDAVREQPKSGEPGAVFATGRQVTGYRGDPEAKRDHPRTISHLSGAPPLDWWNIPPGGYPGSHYAVFPPELCVKPIKAMCPEKVCVTCGEPSRRIVERGELVATPTARMVAWDRGKNHGNDVDRGGMAAGLKAGGFIPNHVYPTTTTGFSDCSHDGWRPGLVLDPFAGSGTTLAVATGHGRDAIGIDLDERNYQLALDRVGPFILERAS